MCSNPASDMAKFNSKQTEPVDVLVLGDHPCAYLAGALLRQKSKLRVVQATLDDHEADDRLVTINPAMFDLHPLLENLKKSLPATPVYGLRFLSDNPDAASEHRVKSAVTLVAKYTDIRDQIATLAEPEGVEYLSNQAVQIHRIDEEGLTVTIGKHSLRPKALVLGGNLSPEQKALLGMPDSWGPDVVHRFTSVRCKAGKHFVTDSKTLMPMSLDLCGNLCWGWLLPHDGEIQLIVEQAIEKATPTERWIAPLPGHWPMKVSPITHC
jgi:hypothetical protein